MIVYIPFVFWDIMHPSSVNDMMESLVGGKKYPIKCYKEDIRWNYGYITKPRNMEPGKPHAFLMRYYRDTGGYTGTVMLPDQKSQEWYQSIIDSGEEPVINPYIIYIPSKQEYELCCMYMMSRSECHSVYDGGDYNSDKYKLELEMYRCDQIEKSILDMDIKPLTLDDKKEEE